jgi:hypothetical protein
MLKNPMSVGVSQVKQEFQRLDFHAQNFIPAVITAATLGLVILCFRILWPYGLVAVIEDLIRGIMAEARDELRDLSAVEAMPFVVAIGLYFVVWLPFAALCLPFVIIGGIGRLIAVPKKETE